MKKNKPLISYEPDADILTIEINNRGIDYASEVGNLIVHFTKDNTPVLVEFLEASKFLVKAENLIEKANANH